MAGRTVTIELVEPRLDHDEREVTELVLREPNLDEVVRHGEPIEVHRTTSGEVYTTENPDALRAYVECLVVSPKSKAIVRSLGLTDALRIKDEIQGFFLAARLAASSTSPSSSPSISESSTSIPAAS